jgi:TIGR01244 family protein
MARIIPLEDTLAVAPQITADDVAEIAAAGYTVILCNRPDGEEFGQPEAAEIAAAAKAAGLAFHHSPIDMRGIGPHHLQDLENLGEGGARVLAYCRTGTRCATLWALHRAASLAPDTVLETAARAGYQLGGLRPMLEARHGEGAAG